MKVESVQAVQLQISLVGFFSQAEFQKNRIFGPNGDALNSSRLYWYCTYTMAAHDRTWAFKWQATWKKLLWPNQKPLSLVLFSFNSLLLHSMAMAERAWLRSSPCEFHRLMLGPNWRMYSSGECEKVIKCLKSSFLSTGKDMHGAKRKDVTIFLH